MIWGGGGGAPENPRPTVCTGRMDGGCQLASQAQKKENRAGEGAGPEGPVWATAAKARGWA